MNEEHMEAHRAIHEMEGSKENEGSKMTSRKSSILKPPKHREPLQDVDFRLNSDLDGSSITRTCTRKVSFHSLQTKEFHVEEAVTVWGQTYEETFKSSDSSHQTDSASYPSATSIITGFDHLLSSNIFPHSISGVEEMKDNINDSCFHTRFSDVEEYDDEQCLTLPKMNVCDQSIEMEFTEPLNFNSLNLNQVIDRMEYNEVDLTKSLTHQIGLDCKSNSELSAVLVDEIKTGERDMEITGMLSDVHSEFEHRVKLQKRSNKDLSQNNMVVVTPDRLFKVSYRDDSINLEAKMNRMSRQTKNKTYDHLRTDVFSNNSELAEFEQSSDVNKRATDSDSPFLRREIQDSSILTNNDISFTDVIENDRKEENMGNYVINEYYDNLSVSQLSHKQKNSENNQSMDLTKPIGKVNFFHNREMVKLSGGLHMTDFGTPESVCSVSDGKTCADSKADNSNRCTNLNEIDLTCDDDQKQIISTRVIANQSSIDNIVEMTRSFRCKTTENCSELSMSSDGDNDFDMKQRQIWSTITCSPTKLTSIFTEEPSFTSSLSESDDMELRNVLKETRTKVVRSDEKLTNETKQKKDCKSVEAIISENDTDMEMTNVLCQYPKISALNENDSSMEFTNEVKKDEACNSMGKFNVNNKHLTSVLKQGKNSIGKLSKTINVSDLKKKDPISKSTNRSSDMIIAPQMRQKKESNVLEESSSVINNVGEVVLSEKYEMQLTKLINPGNINEKVLTNKKVHTQSSHSLELSLNVDEMELTNEVKKKMNNPGEVISCADNSDMELTRGKTHMQSFGSLGLSLNMAEMELTNEMMWKKLDNSGEVISCADNSNMELIRENMLKLSSGSLGLSVNMADMGLTDGIKWKDAKNSEEVSCIVNESGMELTSDKMYKQSFNLEGVSDFTGDNTDMELTNGIKWRKVGNCDDMVSYVDTCDMELINDKMEKQTSSSVEMSVNMTKMELTDGINWKKIGSSRMVIGNTDDSDKELTSNKIHKQCSYLDISNCIHNTTVMKLTNEINLKQTDNPEEVMSCADISMELINEKMEKKTSSSLGTSAMNNNDLKIVDVISQNETSNFLMGNHLPEDNYAHLEVTNCTKHEDMYNEFSVSHKFSNFSNVHLSNAIDCELAKTFQKTDDIDDTRKQNRTFNFQGLLNRSPDIGEDTVKQKEMWGVIEESAQYRNVELIDTDEENGNNNPNAVHCLDTISSTCLLKSKGAYEVKISTTDKLPLDVNNETDIRQISPSLTKVNGTLEQIEVENNEIAGKNMDSLNYVQLFNDHSKQTEDIFQEVILNTSEECNNLEPDDWHKNSTLIEAPMRVAYNHSVHQNTRTTGKRSHECYTNLSTEKVSVDQKSQNENTEKICVNTRLSKCKHSLKNSETSTDSTYVSKAMSSDAKFIKENLESELLNEINISTSCICGTAKKFPRTNELENVSNFSIQNNRVQYIPEQSTLALKNNAGLFLTEEESVDKHNLKQAEPGESYAKSQPDMKNTCVDNATPINSKEKTDTNQNLNNSLLHNISLPNEMNLSIVKDLSSDADESHEQVLENVGKADETKSKSYPTSNECSLLLEKSNSSETNSEKNASLSEVPNATRSNKNKSHIEENFNNLELIRNGSEQKINSKGHFSDLSFVQVSKLDETKEVSNGYCENMNLSLEEKQRNVRTKMDIGVYDNETNEVFCRSSLKEMDGQKELRNDSNVDTEILLVEKQIKEEELRCGNVWKIKELGDSLWSFHFLYNSLTLVLKLNPSVMKNELFTNKAVTNIELISHATEKTDPLVKFVHRVLICKFKPEILETECKMSDDVMKVLEAISREVNNLIMFMKDFNELEILEMAQLKNNCVSFVIADLDIRTMFRMDINLDSWGDISPTDVSVENIVGSVSEEEIKHLATAANRGSGCLRDYVKIIKEYVTILGKR